ncbi:unnamed protein product [Arabis nemorensis]|uniref:Uncharacterized protein n=1 Tax=Arabis nemorensis TaxID=586526 RepID=A0A565CIB3_9BRAS|nr:unnamed protein product [Arabis nemorensis]
MGGVEEEIVVECYPLRVYTRNDFYMNRPSLSMRGKEFFRHIYHPIEGPHVLVNQTVVQEHTYECNVPLPASAMRSIEHLQQSIAAAEPPVNERIINPQFMHLNETWEEVVHVLSQHVNNTGALTGRDPFMVEAEDAFGTIYLIREENGWRSGDWRQYQPPQDEETNCNICGDDITQAPGDVFLGSIDALTYSTKHAF